MLSAGISKGFISVLSRQLNLFLPGSVRFDPTPGRSFKFQLPCALYPFPLPPQ